MSTASRGRFIDSAANAMDGNGEKLRQTLAQLSGVGRILADGSGNIVDIIKNLQTFVTALRDSDEQIVQFQNRFATLTSVLDDSRSDLDAALKNLSVAVGRRTSGSSTAPGQDRPEQIQRLANVTQNLVDHRTPWRTFFTSRRTQSPMAQHARPAHRGASWVFVFNNLPIRLGHLLVIGALENATAPTQPSCARNIWPALRLRNCDHENAVPDQSLLLPSSPSPTTCFDTPTRALARRRRPGSRAAGNPARGVRVHGVERRCATACRGFGPPPGPRAGPAAARRRTAGSALTCRTCSCRPSADMPS